MDETIFRQKLQGMQQHPCPFQKAILNTCAACSRSVRVQIAEREVVACGEPASQLRCLELHRHLRHNFGFVVGNLHDEVPIPHGQEMRIQCGGLRGLGVVLAADPEIRDIDALLDRIAQTVASLDSIDFSAVIHAAREHYQGRRH